MKILSLRELATKHFVEQTKSAAYPHKITDAYIAGYTQCVDDFKKYIQDCSLGHGNYSFGEIDVDFFRPLSNFLNEFHDDK